MERLRNIKEEDQEDYCSLCHKEYKFRCEIHGLFCEDCNNSCPACSEQIETELKKYYKGESNE
ncbi:MAG: hypothetical protein PHE73_09165 [Sulfurovaceae bacterium]|nr:hypothetical protein [Sulfurovaceae bacterium]